MFMRLLLGLLGRIVREGRLTLIDADGARHQVGGETGPAATIRLHDRKLPRELFLNPDLAFPEAYMDERISFEEGSDVHDLLSVFAVNVKSFGGHPWQHAMRKLRRVFRRLQQNNPIARARDNASHHYDLSEDLYRLFLDADMQYSCAFFRDENESLDAAQANKVRRILSKLDIKPGAEVLEIGCGWGGLAMAMARQGAQVLGLSLAEDQLATARTRVEGAGLQDQIRFAARDYREIAETYDRVVSIAMMEAVGAYHHDAYFAAIRERLKPDGVALVHCIGRMSPPGTTAPFIRKHIFPGGHLPALSEVFAATERQGLWVCDVEIWRTHYAKTLRHWRRRFAARREEAKAIYDERFCRMWEFYLALSEIGFSHGPLMVFHLVLARERDAAPIVRDAWLDAERAMAAADATEA